MLVRKVSFDTSCHSSGADPISFANNHSGDTNILKSKGTNSSDSPFELFLKDISKNTTTVNKNNKDNDYGYENIDSHGKIIVEKISSASIPQPSKNLPESDDLQTGYLSMCCKYEKEEVKNERSYIDKLEEVKRLYSISYEGERCTVIDDLLNIHNSNILPLLSNQNSNEFSKHIIENKTKFKSYNTFLSYCDEIDRGQILKKLEVDPLAQLTYYKEILLKDVDNTSESLDILEEIIEDLKSDQTIRKITESPLPHEYLGRVRMQGHLTVKNNNTTRVFMVILQEPTLTMTIEISHDLRYETHILLKEITEFHVVSPNEWIILSRGRGRENTKKVQFFSDLNMKRWVEALKPCLCKFNVKTIISDLRLI